MPDLKKTDFFGKIKQNFFNGKRIHARKLQQMAEFYKKKKNGKKKIQPKGW